jgi:hypothetical protein
MRMADSSYLKPSRAPITLGKVHFIHYIQLTVADKARDILRVKPNPNMIQGTSNDKLELLKEDLQRARAEQETQRTIRKVEIDAEKQAREDAARGRHEDMINQMRAMRELLHGQRESQAQRVEQMDQRHAEQVRQHESTVRQMSDIQAAVTSLHDEQRARSEQHAEEHALAKAGGYPRFPMDVNFQMIRFDSKDVEAAKKMSESVAETRDELLSIADGMTISSLTVGESNLTVSNRTARRIDSPTRGITTHFVGECIRAGECVLE